MGEVLVVNKEMAILLLSHRGWIFLFSSWFSLGLCPCMVLRLATFFSFARLVFGFRWHRGVPKL